MQKKLKRFWALLLLSLISTFAFGETSNHLSHLRSKFPFGLLGDDYGVLTINDLALNACHFKPESFVPGVLTPYEYWQCFESNALSLTYRQKRSIDGEGIFGRVTLKVYKDQLLHEFIESRPSPARESRRFARNLKKLIRDSSHVCISASYIEHNLDKSGQKTALGIFHRLKSTKGYEGEAGRFTNKIRRAYCPKINL